MTGKLWDGGAGGVRTPVSRIFYLRFPPHFEWKRIRNAAKFSQFIPSWKSPFTPSLLPPPAHFLPGSRPPVPYHVHRKRKPRKESLNLFVQRVDNALPDKSLSSGRVLTKQWIVISYGPGAKASRIDLPTSSSSQSTKRDSEREARERARSVRAGVYCQTGNAKRTTFRKKARSMLAIPSLHALFNRLTPLAFWVIAAAAVLPSKPSRKLFTGRNWRIYSLVATLSTGDKS